MKERPRPRSSLVLQLCGNIVDIAVKLEQGIVERIRRSFVNAPCWPDSRLTGRHILVEERVDSLVHLLVHLLGHSKLGGIDWGSVARDVSLLLGGTRQVGR